MRFFLDDRKIEGVVAPVFSLKHAGDTGCGEFADLAALGEWAAQSGLKIIQILPINDTADDPSPYMANSAFALHPIYIRLSDLSLTRPEAPALKRIKTKLTTETPVYADILAAKSAALEKLFKALPIDFFSKNRELADWIKANDWIKPYAVYRTLKEKNKSRPWWLWAKADQPSADADIESRWETHQDRVYFFAWVQYELELQLRSACVALEKMGVALKGDIPIMMNRDSADVWTRPELFNLEESAGAPPDQYGQEGQNWGFPCYRWIAHKKEKYAWWRARMSRAALFFHAYRVDHVLGFFRIWSISSRYSSGTLGRFDESVAITPNALAEAGFNEERLLWMSVPHVPEGEARAIMGDDFNRISAVLLERVGQEPLFKFKEKITEAMLVQEFTKLEPPLAPSSVDYMRHCFRNIALIKDADGYRPSWFYRDSRSYASLNNEEKGQFDNLVSLAALESERLWEINGRERLTAIVSATDMLPCAEDLGAVPPCVPRVLKELGILSLRVARWSKYWSEYGSPWEAPSRYPEFSVATLSVHDSTTLRGWWLENEPDKYGFLEAMGLSGLAGTEGDLKEETIFAIINAFVSQSNSRLVILAIQDWLAMHSQYRASNPAQARINVPGVGRDQNWAYRMGVELDTLIEDKKFSLAIKSLTKAD